MPQSQSKQIEAPLRTDSRCTSIAVRNRGAAANDTTAAPHAGTGARWFNLMNS